jgi:hypothetical protein
MVKYLSFYNSSFALRYFSMQMARPQCNTPQVVMIWGIEQRMSGTLPSLCTDISNIPPYLGGIFIDTRCPPKYTSKFLCMLLQVT